MTKKLTVILGAGATAGAVIPGVNSTHSWNPPITKDIFNIRFESTLNKFEFVQEFAGINAEVENGATLESYLQKHIGTKLTYSKLTDNRRRQLNQFPLYLQALFKEITTLFGSNYYQRLVNLLFADDIKVTFITLNYDLLLDYAIEKAAGVSFESFASYFSNQHKWVLIKPHGSINWFRQIKKIYGQSGYAFESWKAIVSKINILEDLDSAIELAEIYKGNLENSFIEGFIKQVPFYPALAIPNGEYEMVFPVENFRSLLQTNLRECENFLLIGFSAYAKDLLKVLHENVQKVNKLKIVGHKHTQDTYDALVKDAPVFTQKDPIEAQYGLGFAEFLKIKSGTSDLENFLQNL